MREVEILVVDGLSMIVATDMKALEIEWIATFLDMEKTNHILTHSMIEILAAGAVGEAQ